MPLKISRSTVVAGFACHSLLVACVGGEVAFSGQKDDPNHTDPKSTGGSSAASGGSIGSGGTSGSSGNSGSGGSPGAGGSTNSNGGSSSKAGSSSGGSSGSSSVGGEGPVIEPADRGATLPFFEYEAEDGETNGVQIGPSRRYTEIASEASQRKAVRLESTGQYVRLKSKHAANSIVVRYAIPDNSEGTGIWSTLSVYVNGEFRKRLTVTSRYSWTYGPFENNPSPNSPSMGTPHHFFDESRALIGDIPAGATVTVQKDASDNAPYYVIDLIDLEFVPRALPQPAGYRSITECGATPDDDTDDQAAIQACIDAARDERRGLYIPPGTFRSLAKPLSVTDVTIRGAGMWYSTISGFNARFDCYRNNCKYYDFSVFGDTIVRDPNSPESGFSGRTGHGTHLENIWVEHSKIGYWVGIGEPVDGLMIRNCRFRNLHADGINFYKGVKNSTVEQSHFRNTGDDALASWSPADGEPSENNVFRFNTVQLPWMANCFGLYGGRNNRIEDNVCQDTVQFPGMLFARQFDSQPFTGTQRIVRNTLIRAGGPGYGEEQGALKIHAQDGNVAGFVIEDLFIRDSTFSGIHIQGGQVVDNVRFDRISIVDPGTAGLKLNFDARGAADAAHVVVNRGGLLDEAKGRFTWIRGAGNSGW